MPKNFSLQTLIDLAQIKSDAAAVNLGRLNAQDRGMEEKLRLLLQYRDDYQSRFQESARSGMNNAGWRNFHEFMNQLDAAIAQQCDVVANLKHRVQHGRHELLAQQSKLKSFDALSQRHLLNESRHAAKQEQKEHDEHASRSHASRRAPERK